MRTRRNLLILGTATLLTAACGSAGDDSSSGLDLEPVELEPVVDVTTDATPTDAAPASGAATLAAALQTTSDAQAYRAEMALGMDMTAGDGAFAMVFDADPTQPMIFIDVDAEGEQHVRIDMGAMMTSILAADGMSSAEVEALLGDMTMEMWLSGDVMTVDIEGFDDLLSSSAGGAALFPADVFTVDAARLGEEVGMNDLATAMSGQTAPDPTEIAAVLSDVLGDANVSDGEFAGTIGFVDYARAFGQDPDMVVGSGMTGLLGQSGGAEAFDVLLDVYASMEVDVSGTITDGSVDTLRFDMDLSAIWDELPAVLEATGEPMSTADLDEFRELIENATFDMTVLIDYDLDPSIEVAVPTGDFPDATDLWVEMFGPLLR